MRTPPDAGDELDRALKLYFSGFSGRVVIEGARSRSWASITFSGAHHRLSLLLDGHGAGEAVSAFLNGLGEREFALRGHLVADIAGDLDELREDWARLTLEALTVELD